MGYVSRNSGTAAEPAYTLPPQTSDASSAPARREFRDLPFLLRLVFIAPAIALSLAAAAVGVLFLFFSLTLPDPLSMRPTASGPVTRILARDGALIDERGAGGDYIPLDLLPRRVTDAILATEDRRFFSHMGLDPIGLTRALYVNYRAGHFAEGGSTLTQQLAKNLYLSSERTLARKVEELVLAFWLELKLGKRDILELYLNRVYFGGGAYGIEAAAHRYFGKSARDLTLAEAAVIAGLLKAPSKYAPSASPEQAIQRGKNVLEKMRDAGFITAEEEQATDVEKVHFAGVTRAAERNGVAYATDYVMEELAQIPRAVGADVTVETTIDGALQRRASAIMTREIADQGAALAVSEGAAVVLARDGGIRALVGGRSYAETQFNRAVRARRQPGSAFKPVVYLAALEAGYTPDTLVVDLPLTIGRWSPRNDGGQYKGAVTMRDALAHSLNSVAVRLLLDVGAGRVAATARRLGIRSPLRKDASLALGTSEVSLLELVGAYGTLANGGGTREPYVIRRVRTSTGETLFERKATEPRASVAPQHVAAMADMLGATVASGTGRRAAVPGHATAGKTGTSQEFRDAWFVGYTGVLAGGVWIGNDDGAPMHKVKGGSLPADIWRQIMIAAHEGKAPASLPDNAGDETASLPGDDPIARLVGSGEGKSLYPAAPIGNDFISRALDRGTLERGDLEAPKREPAVAESPSIIVRPPSVIRR